MAKVLLFGREIEDQRRLVLELGRQEHILTPKEDVEEVLYALEEEPPDILLVHINPELPPTTVREIVQACTGQARIPVMALLLEEHLGLFDLSLGFDDFQLLPVSSRELAIRIQQTLRRLGKLPRENQDIIQCGDLIVDTTRYEVFVAGHPLELTFKEYELLRFLASNPDKVFTREVLLNRVWGYDYYGGARTVDVHIRRLRSKIEDKDHLFIETVRNVGYRFRPTGPEGAGVL